MRGIAKSLPANCNLRRLLADYSIEQKLYRQQSTLGFQPAPSEAECLALAGCWKSTLDAHFGPEAFAANLQLAEMIEIAWLFICHQPCRSTARCFAQNRGQGLYSLGALIATYVEVSDEADQLRAYSVARTLRRLSSQDNSDELRPVPEMSQIKMLVWTLAGSILMAGYAPSWDSGSRRTHCFGAGPRKLTEDHANARFLAQGLAQVPPSRSTRPRSKLTF